MVFYGTSMGIYGTLHHFGHSAHNQGFFQKTPINVNSKPVNVYFFKNTHKRKFKTRKRIFSWAYSKACNRKLNWSNPIWPHWGKDTSTPLEVSNGNSRRGSVAPPPSGHRPTGRRWHCRAWSMHRKVGGALEKEPAVSWNMLFPRGHMNKWTCMSKNMPYFIPLYI